MNKIFLNFFFFFIFPYFCRLDFLVEFKCFSIKELVRYFRFA